MFQVGVLSETRSVTVTGKSSGMLKLWQRHSQRCSCRELVGDRGLHPLHPLGLCS